MSELVKVCNGLVVGRKSLCDDHEAITLRCDAWPPSLPGQFVHLCPAKAKLGESQFFASPSRLEPLGLGPEFEWRWDERLRMTLGEKLCADVDEPLIRRAFSIADLRESGMRTEIDVIFRIVGKATRWLAQRLPGDEVSVLGPLGRPFPLPEAGKKCWLVAGGVGIPPLMWLGKTLASRGTSATAFVGARSRRFLPLAAGPKQPDVTAVAATSCLEPFASMGISSIVATDDGSWGFDGRVGAALRVFAKSAGFVKQDSPRNASSEAAEHGTPIIYVCGPEPMMEDAARFAEELGASCWVCVERSMACGLQTCQSCVVPVRSEAEETGWRYALCCTEGPVFNAERILWVSPTR